MYNKTHCHPRTGLCRLREHAMREIVIIGWNYSLSVFSTRRVSSLILRMTSAELPS